MFAIATISLMTDGSEFVCFGEETYESYEDAQESIPETVYLSSGEMDRTHHIVSRDFIDWHPRTTNDLSNYPWERFDGEPCSDPHEEYCGCCDNCLDWMARVDVEETREESIKQKEENERIGGIINELNTRGLILVSNLPVYTSKMIQKRLTDLDEYFATHDFEVSGDYARLQKNGTIVWMSEGEIRQWLRDQTKINSCEFYNEEKHISNPSNKGKYSLIRIPILNRDDSSMEISTNKNDFVKKMTQNDEESIAHWLGNMRLAKYRYDRGLPMIEGYEEWDQSLEQYSIEQGFPDMFVANKSQIAMIEASNATVISYEN